MQEFGANFVEEIGEASFYGPKIDVQIKNVHGKEDTIATIQVDFYSAKRFNLKYIDKASNEKEPVLLHRAIMGSFDRFFAFLVEQYGGAFPLWLAPVQIQILTISEKHKKYANNLADKLKDANLRVEVNDSDETIGKKIREGETQKIPYLFIVGDKEAKNKKVAVRQRGGRDLGILDPSEIIKRLQKEISEKTIF